MVGVGVVVEVGVGVGSENFFVLSAYRLTTFVF